jgi:hypothetical protein
MEETSAIKMSEMPENEIKDKSKNDLREVDVAYTTRYV